MACVVETEKPQTERTRHSRKYVEGNLGPHSFVFRGPNGKLKLKAHNLQLFVLIADGIDDDTWMFHLKNGEYSQWFRKDVKDPELADAAVLIEHDVALDAAASRERIRHEIETRYTLPADEPSGIVDDEPEVPPPAAGDSSARSTRPSA
jgi:hypothetical protein